MNNDKQPFCPICQNSYPLKTFFCALDGTKLIQPSSDPIIGKKFNERYQITAKMDQGGMGTVYKARQFSTSSYVAIKIISPSLAKNKDIVDRFKREVKLQSMLEHPNIVTLIDFAKNEDNQYYFVMKLVEGVSLSEELKKKSPFSLKLFFDTALQICNGMEYAHSKNIIHRDLKTDNIIMVDLKYQKIIKILDFGLAKVIDTYDQEIENLTKKGVAIGSPSFISPEQAKGEIDKISPKSDIYSLGIIFYQLLTGVLPFKADSIWMILKKQMTEQAIPPIKLNTNIPKKLNNLILKCMHKNPFERYNSIEEIKKELLQISSSKKFHFVFSKGNADEHYPTKTKDRSKTKTFQRTSIIYLLFIITLILYLILFHDELRSIYNKHIKKYVFLSNTNLSTKTSLDETADADKQETGYPNEKIKPGKHLYNYDLPFASTGSLTITTIPKSAKIYHLNRFLGETPIQIESLLPELINITIQKDGYKKINKEFNIKQNKHLKPSIIILEPETGNLEIAIKLISKNLKNPTKGFIKIGSTKWKEIDLPWIERNLRCQKQPVALKIPGYKIISNNNSTAEITIDKTALIEFQIKADPNFFYIKGRDLYLKKKFKLAIADFQKAITINPNQKDIYLWLAQSFDNLNNLEQSIKYYKKHLTFSSLKQQEKETSLKRVTQLQKKHNQINNLYTQSITLIYQHEYKKAYNQLSKAIELNPTDTSLLLWRGKTSIAANLFENALSDFDQVLKISPANKLALYEKGITYNQSNRYEMAILIFNEAIKQNTDYADAYFDRGWSYYKLKKHEKAMADFKKAAKLNPKVFALISYKMISKIFEENKDHKNYLNTYKYFLKMFPKNHIDWETHNKLYQQKITKLKENKK